MARMEHFAIFAADPKALKDFYIEAMGLRLAVDNGAASPPGYFLVDDAGLALEIIGRPPGAEAADTRYVCHVAFTVDDVVRRPRHRLEGLGPVLRGRHRGRYARDEDGLLPRPGGQPPPGRLACAAARRLNPWENAPRPGSS